MLAACYRFGLLMGRRSVQQNRLVIRLVHHKKRKVGKMKELMTLDYGADWDKEDRSLELKAARFDVFSGEYVDLEGEGQDGGGGDASAANVGDTLGDEQDQDGLPSEEKDLVEERILELLPMDGPLTPGQWAGLRIALMGQPNRGAAAATTETKSPRALPKNRGRGRSSRDSGTFVSILAVNHNTIITPGNFDSLVLRKLMRLGLVWAARSFYEYQQQRPGHCFQVPQIEPFFNYFIQEGVAAEHEDFVWEICSRVFALGPENVVPFLYWHAIESLARTKLYWRRGLEAALAATAISGEAPLAATQNDNCSVRSFSRLAMQAHSTGGDESLFWQLLESPNFHLNTLSLRQQLTRGCELAQDLAYVYWIQHAAALRDSSTTIGDAGAASRRALERLFRYFHEFDVHIGPGTQAALVEYFHLEPDQRAELGKIKASTGRCSRCATKLKVAEFAATDLAALQSALLDEVITRSDIYYSSSPEEHRSFMALLENNNNNDSCNNKNQFDIVIDGLNVALVRTPGLGAAVKPIGLASINLYQVVRHFHELGLRILLVHRKMIEKYPHYDQMANMAKIVPLSGLTADDPYILLAALHSGNGCRIVSNDHYRQHCVLLAAKDPAMARLFTRWQIAHQIFVTGFEQRDSGKYVGAARFIYPPKHAMSAVQDGAYWHLPGRDPEAPPPAHSKNTEFSSPLAWLCLGPHVADQAHLRPQPAVWEAVTKRPPGGRRLPGLEEMLKRTSRDRDIEPQPLKFGQLSAVMASAIQEAVHAGGPAFDTTVSRSKAAADIAVTKPGRRLASNSATAGIGTFSDAAMLAVKATFSSEEAQEAVKRRGGIAAETSRGREATPEKAVVAMPLREENAAIRKPASTVLKDREKSASPVGGSAKDDSLQLVKDLVAKQRTKVNSNSPLKADLKDILRSFNKR